MILQNVRRKKCSDCKSSRNIIFPTMCNTVAFRNFLCHEISTHLRRFAFTWGLNNTGCGCQFSEFGCCPDSTTEAKGEDFFGCPCETYQHGCCMDGIKIAEGPNLEGCADCCPDGVTPKVIYKWVDSVSFCKHSKLSCYHIAVLIRSLTISHLAVDDWGRGVWLRVFKIRMLLRHGNSSHRTTLWGVLGQARSRMPFTTPNWTMHQLHCQVVLRHQVWGLLEVLVRRLRTRSEPFWWRGWMQTGMWKSKRTSSMLP